MTVQVINQSEQNKVRREMGQFVADASNEGGAVHGSSIGLAPNTCFWQVIERKSEHAMAVALALHEHSCGWKSVWLTTLALA